MNINEIFEMYFNSLVKIKYNTFSLGGIDKDLTSEFVGILDRAILESFKIARTEGYDLVFDLSKIDSYSDYPYTVTKPQSREEFVGEIMAMTDHILSHLKELMTQLNKTADVFVVSALNQIAMQFYNFKLNL